MIRGRWALGECHLFPHLMVGAFFPHLKALTKPRPIVRHTMLRWSKSLLGSG
jgi:hypothetical protein